MSPTKHRVKQVEYPEYPLTIRNLRLALAGRLGRPLKQNELAKKLGISSPHMSNIERGREKPTQQTQYDMAELFQIDIQIVRAAARGSLAKLDDEGDSDKELQKKTKSTKGKS